MNKSGGGRHTERTHFSDILQEQNRFDVFSAGSRLSCMCAEVDYYCWAIVYEIQYCEFT